MLLALSVLIGFLGIAITLALSVIERTRELGLLRAVGMNRSQVWSMVSLESLLIAMLGTFLGIVLGVVGGVALSLTFREDIDTAKVDIPYLVADRLLHRVGGVRAARLDLPGLAGVPAQRARRRLPRLELRRRCRPATPGRRWPRSWGSSPVVARAARRARGFDEVLAETLPDGVAVRTRASGRPTS